MSIKKSILKKLIAMFSLLLTFRSLGAINTSITSSTSYSRPEYSTGKWVYGMGGKL